MIVNIVEAIKTRCAAQFAWRVAGAAEFQQLEPAAKLTLPAAYVIPLDDTAEPNQSSNGYRQTIRDTFAVVVVLSNVADELGKASVSQVLPIRNALFAALLSWQPDGEHGEIEYEGGQLLGVDRDRLYYQYEFSCETQISEADTYQGISNSALPAFEGMHINVDMTQPFDPNRVGAGETGPDGTIDASLTVEIPQN